MIILTYIGGCYRVQPVSVLEGDAAQSQNNVHGEWYSNRGLGLHVPDNHFSMKSILLSPKTRQIYRDSQKPLSLKSAEEMAQIG